MARSATSGGQVWIGDSGGDSPVVVRVISPGSRRLPIASRALGGTRRRRLKQGSRATPRPRAGHSPNPNTARSSCRSGSRISNRFCLVRRASSGSRPTPGTARLRRTTSSSTRMGLQRVESRYQAAAASGRWASTTSSWRTKTLTASRAFSCTGSIVVRRCPTVSRCASESSVAVARRNWRSPRRDYAQPGWDT
jgi:hypothetical protein